MSIFSKVTWLLFVSVIVFGGAVGCGNSNGDFTFTAKPSNLSIKAGVTGQITLSAQALNGFNAPVNVTLSSLPSGVTASASTLTVSPGSNQSITLTVTASAAASSSTLTFTAVSGSLRHTSTVSLSIAAAPPPPADFSLTVSPGTATLVAGGAASQIAVLASASNGFVGTIALNLNGLPAGVTFSPATLTLAPGAPQPIILTAAAAAAVGSTTVTLTGTSGFITHSTSLALTIAAAPSPPADFSLSLSPATLSLVVGGSASPVNVLASATNGFTGTVVLSLSGLPAGVTTSPATLSLAPGTPQPLSLLASASAVPGTANVILNGTSGSLTHSTSLALTVAVAPAPVLTDVTTYHYDNSRAGLNAAETILTPSNVTTSTFGLRAIYPVDGKVDAQPLYVSGLALPAGGAAATWNVVYVATEHDSVYALNAATGAQLWKTSVLGTGETTSDSHGCGQITPEIGITSTPVIDRSRGPNGAIFVVGMTKDAQAGYHQRIHALDLLTGGELAGSPTEIGGSYPGSGPNSQNGKLTFDPAQYAERSGLLLLNGTIYLAWTSHCDISPYTGWVMGYSESTLQQVSILNLTPDGTEGSIWMSGFGLGADSNGNIYFLDANGTLDPGFDANGFPSHGDYGNALVKLSTSGGLAVADYFEPFNTVAESAQDQDLGSGGAMLLPDLADNAGTIHHLVVGAGKDGNIYIGDRDHLGKFNQTAANNSNVYQEIPNALPNGAWSGPAYFNNTVFYGGVNDVLKAYPVTNALLSTLPTSQSATGFAYPGTTPSVSANGTANGIVWALESAPGAPAVLHAYDATSLAHELYNSSQAASGRDAFGSGNKFLTPMVVNGNVYVGTPSGVAVFGLLHP